MGKSPTLRFDLFDLGVVVPSFGLAVIYAMKADGLLFFGWDLDLLLFLVTTSRRGN